MNCLRKVSFFQKKTTTHLGSHRFSDEKWLFLLDVSKKKKTNILLMNIDEHVFAEVSYPKRAPFLCVCLCDGLWRAAAHDCSRPWELREAEEAAVCSVALRAAGPSQWHWRWPLTTAHNEVSGATRTKPYGDTRPPQLGSRVSSRSASRREKSSHLGYVPQLHGEEGDAESIKFFKATT